MDLGHLKTFIYNCLYILYTSMCSVVSIIFSSNNEYDLVLSISKNLKPLSCVDCIIKCHTVGRRWK